MTRQRLLSNGLPGALLSLVFLVLVSSCAPAGPKSPEISSGTTYAWAEKKMQDGAALTSLHGDNPELAQHIESAVDAELRQLGFKKVDASEAQLLVDYHISLQPNGAVSSLPPRDGAEAYADPKAINWSAWGGPEESGDGESRYVAGTLILDLHDHVGTRLVWRAASAKVVSAGRVTPSQIQDVVRELVANLKNMS